MTDAPPRGGNPDWIRDELILALDVYFGLAGTVPGPRLSAVVELSNLLRKTDLHVGKESLPNFRSPASVVMKLMNFRSIDPGYGGKGLTAGGRLDREIWREFADDRAKLSRIAAAIRDALKATGVDRGGDETLDWAEALEGAVLTRLHRTRERNARLVQAKKQAELQRAGKLTCEVCGFCFATAYGEIGEGFIECHHRKPLSDLRERQRTSLDHLALLCANCHRMIHGRRPWLTIEELKTAVAITARTLRIL